MRSGLSNDFMLLFILCIVCSHMQLLVGNVGNGSEPIVCMELTQPISEKPCRDHYTAGRYSFC